MFLDESGLDTRMVRSHARAPRGQRAISRVPGGHWSRPAILGAIARAGLARRYLPPYSPDFNPIGQAWSKLKEELRQIGARSIDALDAAMPAALAKITRDDARGWFRHCGYRSA